MKRYTLTVTQKLTVLAPYLALRLVVSLSTVHIVKKRKDYNHSSFF